MIAIWAVLQVLILVTLETIRIPIRRRLVVAIRTGIVILRIRTPVIRIVVRIVRVVLLVRILHGRRALRVGELHRTLRVDEGRCGRVLLPAIVEAEEPGYPLDPARLLHAVRQQIRLDVLPYRLPLRRRRQVLLGRLILLVGVGSGRGGGVHLCSGYPYDTGDAH